MAIILVKYEGIREVKEFMDQRASMNHYPWEYKVVESLIIYKLYLLIADNIKFDKKNFKEL